MAALFDVAVLFLGIAVVAYLFGARRIGGLSMEAARVIIVVFVLLFASAALASTVVAI